MNTLSARQERFCNAEEFFTKRGSVWMKLDRDAAINVIERCIRNDVAIACVEGGIWRNPGFEARIDAIWNREIHKDAGISHLKAENEMAVNFVHELPEAYDTIIISTADNSYE